MMMRMKSVLVWFSSYLWFYVIFSNFEKFCVYYYFSLLGRLFIEVGSCKLKFPYLVYFPFWFTWQSHDMFCLGFVLILFWKWLPLCCVYIFSYVSHFDMSWICSSKFYDDWLDGFTCVWSILFLSYIIRGAEFIS